MARYLSFVLQGVLSAAVRKGLGRGVRIAVEAGKSFVRIDAVPRPDLEEILAVLGKSRLRRSVQAFDLEILPGHVEDPGEETVAFELGAMDADLPANAEEDFETPAPPSVKVCGWLRPQLPLQVFRNPRGHMAAIGQECVADQGLTDLLKSLCPGIVLAPVIWKGKVIPWFRLAKVPGRARILDPELAFNSPAPCRRCGRPLISLRSTLVARRGARWRGAGLTCNEERYWHDRRKAIYLLSPGAAADLTSRFRAGYRLTPVYGGDGRTAAFVRAIKEWLDRYLPSC